MFENHRGQYGNTFPRADFSPYTHTLYRTDFTRANQILEDTKFPIPRADALLSFATQHSVFSSLDLTRGYWQAELSEQSMPLTAFATDFGTYEWCRVPMGVHKSGPYFQDVMQHTVLADQIDNSAVVYIDDVLVVSK